MKTRVRSKDDSLPKMSTSSQARLPLFHPVKKIMNNTSDNTFVVTTKNGTVTVNGYRLTQTHKDILEYIFGCLTPVGDISDKVGATYHISMYALQKALGVSPDHNKKIVQRFEEMQKTVITLEPASNEVKEIRNELTFNIIYASEKVRDANGNALCLEAKFTPHFMMLLSGDFSVDYPALLLDILRLKNAETKALVRMVLTHRNFNRKLSDVLRQIGVSEENGFPRSNISRAKTRILSEAEKLEESFGIRFSEDKDPTVLYSQHEGVFYQEGDPDSFLNFNPKGKGRNLIYSLIERDIASQENIDEK